RRYTSRSSPVYWKNKLLGIPVRLLEDPIWRIDPAFFSVGKGLVLLKGYWAWRRYFEEIKPLLLREFTLCGDAQESLLQWQSRFAGPDSVAVHIRRGDYVAAPEASSFGVQPLEYYRAAMQWMGSRLAKPVFHLFSD